MDKLAPAPFNPVRVMAEKEMPAIDLSSDSLAYLRMQKSKVKSQEYYSKEISRYRHEAEKLKKEISNLQLYIRDWDDRARNKIVPIPVVIPLSTQTTMAKRRDTVFIKDTVRIKDTFAQHITDTVIIHEQGKTKKEYSTIYKTKIDTLIKIKKEFDYSAIPADIILFDVGKASIKTIYKKKLDYLSAILKKNPSFKADISGHTDPSGPARQNQILSEKRATAVAKYLRLLGVNNEQLIVTGMADLNPAVSGHSKISNSKNRRVVVKLIAD